jgi:hypothetical protein
MEQKNNIVEKALAILYRQPEKLEAINQSEQKRSATLSGVREVWRRLFKIDVDATRKAAGLSSLEDHVAHSKERPTPLADALLANTDRVPRTSNPVCPGKLRKLLMDFLTVPIVCP